MRTCNYTREDMSALLRQHAINPTHQRIEIAHAMFTHREHLCADQIMAIVNAKHSETSKATVYNTLNLFKQHKLVREVLVDPSKVFYDPNTTPHHHFFNVESGELMDIDGMDVRVEGLPALPDGLVTEGVDVIVRIRSRAT